MICQRVTRKNQGQSTYQQLKGWVRDDAKLTMAQALTCLDVHCAEDLCTAWLRYVRTGRKGLFRKGFMQAIYELGVDEWLESPDRPHGYEDFYSEED